MRKKKYCIGMALCMTLLADGCAGAKVSGIQTAQTAEAPQTTQTDETPQTAQTTEMPQTTHTAGTEAETGEGSGDTAQTGTAEETGVQAEILHFVDVFGEEYQVEILPDVEKQDYRMECFVHDGDMLSYEGDSRYTYRLGVDVSHHQGTINWQAVKDAGIGFVFLRIGYRGYGTEGVMKPDTQFADNIRNAQDAGIDVGVYFFSQAVSEEEAREEAEFVLQMLKGYELQLPVVYDPENILDDVARTDNVTGEQFTKNTLLFCDLVREAGYEPMIYSNMLWEAYQYDMTQLEGIPIWYADYEPAPQTPYYFTFWQYTNEGHVAGISGAVDLDIQMIPQ